MRRLSTAVVITLGIAGIIPTWQSVHRASAQAPNVIALQPPRTTVGGNETGYALPSADPERAIQESRSLRMHASQLETDGQFTRARDLLERALTITVTVKGASDLEVAAVAAQLAGVYRSLPDSTKSEALYRRAIAIREAALGTGDPLTALAQSQLAVLYQHTGDRRKAEALLADAMATIERTVGQEHPWFVSCLITLANLRNDARDLEEEEQILRRAIAISERIEETNSVQFARLLNNLGELYRQKQDYARAERLFSQALCVGGGACRWRTSTASRPHCKTSASLPASARSMTRRSRTTHAPCRSESGPSEPIIRTSPSSSPTWRISTAPPATTHSRSRCSHPGTAHLAERGWSLPAGDAPVGREHRPDLRGVRGHGARARVPAPFRCDRRGPARTQSGGRLRAAEAGVCAKRGRAHRQDDLAASE